MEKENLCVVLRGCDDKTVIDIGNNVSKEILEFLEFLSKQSKKISEYPCMPIMKIDELKNYNEEDEE